MTWTNMQGILRLNDEFYYYTKVEQCYFKCIVKSES